MNIKKYKKANGFTLIEVIVAVSIVIILATLAVPRVSGYISKAKDAKVMSIGKQIYNAAMWSYADQGSIFDSSKVKDTISNVASVTLSDPTNAVTTSDSGKSIKIDYVNDSKKYELSIGTDTNNYTITDITNIDSKTTVFSTTQ